MVLLRSTRNPSDFVRMACISGLCQVVEDGYEFFAKRQLVTLFSAPNYCGEFDNAGGMMSVDDNLLCSFQVSCCHQLHPQHVLMSAVVESM